MSAGELRVYLGGASGVGTTFRMLEEGHRRLARGSDVVVGVADARGRPRTKELLDGLETVPTRSGDVDVAAVLARAPEVVLVDDLPHTNAPGAANEHRWQDVRDLLAAGVDVVTTMDVGHFASLTDVVATVTGRTPRETVPDGFVRAAGQVELVDMAPEALRRRVMHGNVVPAQAVETALAGDFRVGTLTALRELALLWVADKVDEQLDRYRADHHLVDTWETRERVVVALAGGPEGDTLIRRAARVAARTKGADLQAVHVTVSERLADASPADLARQRVLVESLGGTYHHVVGPDVVEALLDFARGSHATQLVLGASRRGRLAQLLAPGVSTRTIARAGSIDVHLVGDDETTPAGPVPARSAAGLSPGRRRAGLVLALVAPPLLTAVLSGVRRDVSLPSDILTFLLAVVAVALVGGLLPALVAALVGFFLLNYFFTPPLHQLTVADRENLFALLAFLVVGVCVSTVVDLAARRTTEASRARAQSQALSTLAGSVLRGSHPLTALLEQVRETFALRAVTLLERRHTGGGDPQAQREPAAWNRVAAVGEGPALAPADGDDEVRVDDPGGLGLSLVLTGHPLSASDRRVVEAFAAQAAVALRQERLAAQAEAVEAMTEVDRLRTALLNAVSHDLRTPLASAKTAVGGLRSADLQLSEEDRAELLSTAEESLDRLERLVANLLDMSRLQAGALALAVQPISALDAVPAALDELGEPAREVRVHAAGDVDDVSADPALLERALVNLVANAVRYSPAGRPPEVLVGQRDGRVEIRVVDHGPGVPSTDWDRIFLPFQRFGDRDTGTGVGLGLALSRGIIEAMGGTVTPEQTLGGGLTMTVSLPVAVPGEESPA